MYVWSPRCSAKLYGNCVSVVLVGMFSDLTPLYGRPARVAKLMENQGLHGISRPDSTLRANLLHAPHSLYWLVWN